MVQANLNCFSARTECSWFSSVKENGDSRVRSLTTEPLLSYHPGERKNTHHQGFYLWASGNCQLATWHVLLVVWLRN